MSLQKAMIIARKDIEEFTKNRYIMATLLVMPLFASIVLPLIYVVPVNTLSRQSSAELDLEFNIVGSLDNATISDATLVDMRLDHVVIQNCIVRACTIDNSTVVNSNLNQSRIAYSTVQNSMLDRCELIVLTSDVGNTVRNSEYVGGSDELSRLKTLMLNVLLILLVIIPVTIPTIVASYSIVGEKANKSLEPVLATPITDLELLSGKALSIFIVSMIASWISLAIAVVMVDIITEPVLGYYPLPNAYWIIGIVFLAPGMCMMSILSNVIISSKVNDVRVSQQIGVVLVVPILLFFFLSLLGVLSTAILPMMLFSTAVVLVDALILLASIRVFRREEILVSWK